LDNAEKTTENTTNGSNGHSKTNGFHLENENGCDSDDSAYENYKFDEISETDIALEMLHGNGSEFNSGNRWYDKTIQVRIYFSSII
jgi:hypothetical protein